MFPDERKSLMSHSKISIPSDPVIGGVYVHYGNSHEYEVTCFALDSDAEGDVWSVVYKPLYTETPADIFVRHVSEWLKPASKDGREVVRYKFVRMA